VSGNLANSALIKILLNDYVLNVLALDHRYVLNAVVSLDKGQLHHLHLRFNLGLALVLLHVGRILFAPDEAHLTDFTVKRML
jgi:hypothetical protein